MLPFIGLSFNLIKLVYYYTKHPFSDFKIQQIEFGLTFANLMISIILIFYQQITFNIDLTLAFLVLIPLAYLVGVKIINYKVNKVIQSFYTNNLFENQKQNENINSADDQDKLAFYLRFLSQQIDCSLSTYLSSFSSIILDSIILKHITTCQFYPDCFCFSKVTITFLFKLNQFLIKNEGSPLTKDQFLEDKMRKKYLLSYIQNAFRDQIENSKSKNITDFFYFSYLSFLINVVKNQTASYREIFLLKIKLNKNMSSKQRQMINYTLYLANQEFSFTKNKKKNNISLDSQNNPNSDGNQNTKQEQLQEQDIIEIILFDEKLDNCSIDFDLCLSDKLLFLEMIGKEYINLIELESLCHKIHFAKVNISNLLKQLLKVNYKHNYLQIMISGFQDCLTIENKLSNLLKIQIKQSIKSLNYLILYSDDSAAIYITLLQEVGKIVKVSRNISNVIETSQNSQNYIGQNVKIIMAEEIAKVHDQILLQSLKSSTFNDQIKSFDMMIGQNQQGWAVALQLKIQMCMIGESDLGACAQIKQINDHNNYIQTSSIQKELKVFVLDKHVYDHLFRFHISIHQVKQIKLARIAPALSILTEISKPGEVFETLIIQPKSIQDALKNRNILDQNFTNELNSSNLYQIKMSCFTRSTDHITYIQYTLIQIKDLNTNNKIQAKREAINQLVAQLKTYHNLNKLKNHFISAVNNNPQFPHEIISDKQHQSEKFLESKNEENSFLSQSESNIHYQQNNEQIDLQNSQIQVKKELNFQNKEAERQIIDDYYPEEKQQFNNKSKNNNQEKLNSNIKITDHDQSQQINDLHAYEKTNKAFLTNQITLNDAPNLIISLPSKQLLLASKRDSKNVNHKDFLLSQDTIGELSQHFLNSEQNMNSPLSTRQLLQSPFNKETPTTFTERQQENFQDDKDQQLSVKRSTPFFPKYEGADKSPVTKQILGINKINTILSSDNFSRSAAPENQENDQSSTFPQQRSMKPNNLKGQKVDKKEYNEGSVGSSSTRISASKQYFEFDCNLYFSYRGIIVKTIQSKNQIGGLKIINFIGLLCMIIIGVLNAASYEILYQDKASQKINFSEIFFCFQEKRYIGFMLASNQLYKSTLLGHYYLGGAENTKAFASAVFSTRLYIFNQLKNLTLEMLKANPNKIYQYQQLIDYKIELYNIDSISRKIKETNIISLYDKIILWESYAYYMANNTDYQNLYNEMAIHNYGNLFSGINQIYEKTKDNFQDQISYSKLIIIIQLVTISISTGILTLFILPIFAFYQKKREKILKLFSTVSIDSIMAMINCVNFYKGKQEFKDCMLHSKKSTITENKLQQSHPNIPQRLYIHNSYQSFKNSSTMAERRENHKKTKDTLKKRNISTTNSLPKFNISILPVIIVCLIFTLFNPFASYLINSYQVDNFQSSLQFLTAMDYFYDNICYLFWIKYVYTYYRLSDPSSEFVATLYDKLNEQLSQSSLLYLNLVNSFSVYEDNSSLYQRQYYENFFLPMFKNDSCTTIKLSTEDFREITINNTICNTLVGGIFKKGLFIASKKGISLLSNFQEITQSQDIAQFKKGLLVMQSYLNIPNEMTFFQNFALMTKMVHYFFADRYEDYYNYVYQLNILFLIVQIILLILVLLIAWSQFYRKLGKQYFLSKQCLDLLSIETLLSNSYMISFFKKGQ